MTCFELYILSMMSCLTFANMFKVMNDEYGTHSKEDGEVLVAIRGELP